MKNIALYEVLAPLYHVLTRLTTPLPKLFTNSFRDPLRRIVLRSVAHICRNMLCSACVCGDLFKAAASSSAVLASIVCVQPWFLTAVKHLCQHPHCVRLFRVSAASGISGMDTHRAEPHQCAQIRRAHQQRRKFTLTAVNGYIYRFFDGLKVLRAGRIFFILTGCAARLSKAPSAFCKADADFLFGIPISSK